MKQHLALLAFSSLMSCAFRSEDHVIVVHSQDPVIIQAAEKAADEWNWCGKEQLLITTNEEYVDNHSLPLFIMPRGQLLMSDAGTSANGLTHWENEDPTWIKVVYFDDTDYYRLVMAHEMGHVLTGKAHQTSGLMFGGLLTDVNTPVTQFECSLFKD